jgi:hypothetical protein
MKKIITEKKRIEPLQMSEEEFVNFILQESVVRNISEKVTIPDELNRRKKLFLEVVDRYDVNSSPT